MNVNPENVKPQKVHF